VAVGHPALLPELARAAGVAAAVLHPQRPMAEHRPPAAAAGASTSPPAWTSIIAFAASKSLTKAGGS
jgi:hypothetical protein